MRKVIKKAGVFALIATLVLTGIALPVKEKAVAETKDYGISNPRVEFLERECVFLEITGRKILTMMVLQIKKMIKHQLNGRF